MANISNAERRWCLEHDVQIDDYKINYSAKQKAEIKEQMTAIIEAEKKELIIQKELEREQLIRQKQLEKEQLIRQKQLDKIEKENLKQQLKDEAREERIATYGEWARGLDFNDKGVPETTITNYCYYFENNPKYKDKLLYDSYTSKYTFNGMVFDDKLYRQITLEVDSTIRVNKPATLIEALKTVADTHSKNSATDLMDNLKWDGKKRLETVFIDMLKVEDTELNRHITKTWLVGAVQRLYNPGCPNENVLILTGAQGAGKSLTLKWLAGEFGFDAAINISSKEQEYGMKLQNCWFCCFDELSGLSKKAAAEYKNWFSITCDSYRPPYGHEVETKYRHNAYCATTNDVTFLKDYSDNNERRMWVLECHATKEDGYKNAKLRDKKLWRQIWAEAVHYYKEDKDFIPYLGAEYTDKLAAMQRKYKDFNADDLGDMLCEILDRPYILKRNGDINDVDDLLKQIRQGYRYRCVDPDEEVDFINHISHSAVKRIVRDILNTSQKHQYLRAALDGKWCVKMQPTKINNKLDRYYVRGKWLDDKEETIERTIREFNSLSTASDDTAYMIPEMDILQLDD